ncbi:MAG: hypothetical protein QM703_22710 [Gemmatales bacterium]
MSLPMLEAQAGLHRAKEIMVEGEEALPQEQAASGITALQTQGTQEEAEAPHQLEEEQEVTEELITLFQQPTAQYQEEQEEELTREDRQEAEREGKSGSLTRAGTRSHIRQ